MAKDLLSKSGELLLYGTVGAGLMFGDDENFFTARDVAMTLSGLSRSKPLTVRLNSGGGIAHEGNAIYSLLKDHQGKITMIVDGVAASAASLIAMAGDDTIMKLGATMMVHDPAGITIGNSKTHQKSIEQLETMATNYSEVYAEKSGETPKKMRDVMQEETWYTAAEAVAAGLADRVDKGGKRREPTAFDYRIYQHAPSELVMMATDRQWQLRSDVEIEAATEREDDDMNKPLTDAEKATLAETRKTGITTACALAGKPDRATAFIADAKMDLTTVMTTLQTEAAADLAAKEKERNGGAETPDQIVARVQKTEQQRCSDITAACAMAGKPSKAAKFITDNKSVTDVLAALQADKSAPENISARGGSQSGTGHADKDVTASWDKQAAKYNKRIGA